MRQHRLHAAFVTIVAAIIGATVPLAAQADIFTWVDASGKVNVSNLDPPEGVRVTSVMHLNPPKVTPPSDAQREALREQEVQALAERVQQLQNEVEYARQQPQRVDYRVAPPPPMMPPMPPMMPYGGEWAAPAPSYAYAPQQVAAPAGCDPAYVGCPFGFTPLYSTLVVVRAPNFRRPGPIHGRHVVPPITIPPLFPPMARAPGGSRMR